MKNRIVLTVLVMLFSLQLAGARTQTPMRPQQQAVIDVAFCLDTTGSMSG